jgi:uncharacterized sulfatase
MKTFFTITTCVLAAVPANQVLAAKRPDKPNILYIMSDDHCATAIGAYGSRLAALNPTPNLDRMAREGIRLDRVFCTNSISSPSRATIITGQYSQANGVLFLDKALEPDRQALPIYMRQAGYQTCIIGKWHLVDEPNFDYYQVLPGQGRYFDPIFFVKGQGTYGNVGQALHTNGHVTDIITDLALDWLKQKRDTSKPFFLCVHHKAPHDMFEYAPRYESYLQDVEIPYPDNLFEQGNHGSIATRGDNDELIRFIGGSVGSRNILRSADNFKFMAGDEYKSMAEPELTKRAYQQYLKKYLRCVKGIDDNVQRIFDYLKEAGILDNTIIIYTGDQGMWLGEHDYIDKRWMYEESMRMPLLVRYPPAIKAGSSSKALINNTDFAPTMLDFAGVKAPASMQGRSFRSILVTGKTPKDWRQATYYRYWYQLTHLGVPAHFGIRTNQYKLIFFYGLDLNMKAIQTPPAWEFYDLDKDPGEMNNVYDDPAYSDIIAKLKTEMLKLREQYGETDKDHPNIQAIIDAHWNTTEKSRAEAVRISHAAREAFEKSQQSSKK